MDPPQTKKSPSECTFYGFKYDEKNLNRSYGNSCPFGFDKGHCLMETKGEKPEWRNCSFNLNNTIPLTEQSRLPVFEENLKLVEEQEERAQFHWT